MMLLDTSCLFQIWPTSFMLIVFIFSIILYWWRYRRDSHLLNIIPGPPGLPIIGNMYNVVKRKGWRITLEISEFQKTLFQEFPKKYGGIYKGWFANKNFVFISKAEFMKPILSSQSLITKSQNYDAFKLFLGHSLLLSTGDHWRGRRRFLTPAFHFNILESFVEVFNECSKSLLLDVTKACEATASHPSLIDVLPILKRTTLDIICDSSMGRQVRGKIEGEEYMNSINKVLEIIMEMLLKPWLLNEFIFNHSALGKEYQKRVQCVVSFSEKIIQDRRATLRKTYSGNQTYQQQNVHENEKMLSPSKYRSFLDFLIETSSEHEDKLTDKDIVEEVNLFIFAGHDTTAVAMSWFLYCMARNPREQKKLFEELDHVFKEDDERFCTMQDTAKMKYLDCCIKETLRLYPSIPLVGRAITEEVRIGEYIIPKNVTAVLLIQEMHRDPKVFSEPNTFKPERFQFKAEEEQSMTTSTRLSHAFVPFSAGPRNCIGQKYAMLELKVVLSWMLRKFQFSLPASCDREIKSSFEIVLKPIGGIPLIVCPRQS